MAFDQRFWKRSRPLWFRLPRPLRIGWIITAMALGPLQPHWILNPKRIRALLLVRDLHSPLHLLMESLLQQGLLAEHILLVDTGSTNPGCLSALSALEKRGCRLINLSQQEQCFGPYAPWLSPTLRRQIRSWRYPYLVSDPDLAIPANIPSDWLAQLFNMLNKHRALTKAALPLSVNDITVENTAAIKAHEEDLIRQWPYRLMSRCLLGKSSKSAICATDTTLALYRPGKRFSTLSIRLSSRYAIKHLPWYESFCQTMEYKYYQKHKLNIFGQWSSSPTSQS